MADLADIVETELLDLLDPDLFGMTDLLIDGQAVAGVFAPEERDQQGTYPGQIVERYRLICRREDLSAAVGEELDIGGQVWAVVQNRTMAYLTDLTLIRYTA